jgi:DNA-binding Xre family transcriptional regulator
LKEKSGISTVSLAKLGKNENLTTAVLVKICNALDCDISEIMEIIPDETEVKKEEVAVHG